MSKWVNIWVYGYRTALEQFMDGRKIADEHGNKSLPHEILMVGPIFPQVEDGVDELGNPRYKRKTGNQKALWLFSLHGTRADLIDQLQVLQGPYEIHDLVNYEYKDFDGAVIQATRPITIDEVRQLYPEHCLGQAIPYIC